MSLKRFAEKMFFHPKWYHYIVIVFLSPLCLFYGVVMYLRRVSARPKEYDIPIVSVGNLIVGGSGKTPFVIALALRYRDVFVVSRGYGRKSSGLKEVSFKGEILVDVKIAGDEAMLMAHSLPNASVLVSEDREEAIVFAKRKGAKCIILDDGFNRVGIKKFDLLLEPSSIKNYCTFPSGPFREFYFTKKSAHLVAKEGYAFKREVTIEGSTERMILITAISNPLRLDRYLPKGVVYKVYYEDHAYFNEDILKALLQKYRATSILCTSKDRVKMQGFKLPISEMKLKLEIQKEVLVQIDNYIKGESYA